jgi:hypothetical protein
MLGMFLLRGSLAATGDTGEQACQAFTHLSGSLYRGTCVTGEAHGPDLEEFLQQLEGKDHGVSVCPGNITVVSIPEIEGSTSYAFEGETLVATRSYCFLCPCYCCGDVEVSGSTPRGTGEWPWTETCTSVEEPEPEPELLQPTPPPDDRRCSCDPEAKLVPPQAALILGLVGWRRRYSLGSCLPRRAGAKVTPSARRPKS